MAGIQKGKAVPDWWAVRKAALSLVGWYLGEWYVADCLGFRRMVLSPIGWLSEGLAVPDWLAFRNAVYWLEAVNHRGSVSILS